MDGIWFTLSKLAALLDLPRHVLSFVDYKPLYQVHNYIALNPLYRVQTIPKIAGTVILQVGLKNGV